MDGIEDQWAKANEIMKERILNNNRETGSIVGMAVERWVQKNRAYRGQQMFLGLKAQFCDINRKFWKLKGILWDGLGDDAFEGAIEICEDMIGHLLITIYFLEQEGYTRTNNVYAEGDMRISQHRDFSDQVWNKRDDFPPIPVHEVCGIRHNDSVPCPALVVKPEYRATQYRFPDG